MTLARISLNSACATELFKSPPCKSARTCKPSWSLSLSISQLVTSVRVHGTTWTKCFQIPWAFRYENSSSSEYGTDDALDKKGETPG